MPKVGYIKTEKHRKNLSEANKGKHSSPETEFKKGHKNYNLRKLKIDVICQWCEKPFYVYPCQIKNGEGKYHSVKCRDLARKGQTSPNKDKKFTEEWKNNLAKSHWRGGIKATRERLKNNLQYQINNRIRSGISMSLRRGIKNGRTWQSLIGYTVKQLERRLKSTMPEGYNWRDFLSGKLEIDHIIPISEFEFEKPEDLQFQQCWSYDNLQLLTVEENNKKRNKLIKSYQTTLMI